MKTIQLTLLALLICFVSCKPERKIDEEKSTPTNRSVKKTSGKKINSKEQLLTAWQEKPKNRIIDWINVVTDSTSKDFIPIKDRIAVFDNDGTLWPEQPVPTQLLYMLDYLKKEYPNKPEWQNDEVISAAVKGNYAPLKEQGTKGLIDMMNKSYNKMSEEKYRESVAQWIDTTTTNKFKKTYKEVVYLPMLQLLDYLRANQFKTYIVSGGGADFMRVWAEEVYKIPPYQVIGSYGDVEYKVVDGSPVVYKMTGDIFFDDKTGKPEAIHRFIGKKPVFCGGNSDGDQAMMQYTSSSNYKTMCVILHHTDSEREYAYDTKTLSGHLETALEEAKEKDWLVVDMKNDFKQIFSFQN